MLQLGSELLLSEMSKLIGEGGYRLRSGDRYLKGQPIFEQSVFLTRYGFNVCMSENTANEFLEQNFYATSKVPLSKYNL